MTEKTSVTGLSIGEVARRSGIHIETIRYYERAGVVPKPPRTTGGQRSYSSDQLNRLVFVRRSRELGFNLNEVRAMLALVDNNKMTCGQIHNLTIRHLNSVQEKLADLKKMERTLKRLASQCSQGDVPNCAIIDTLYGAA